MKDTVCAIVVAAGKGKRMGAGESKQYLKIGGKPILVHTLEAFERAAVVDEVVLVVGEADQSRCTALAKEYGLRKIKAIVAGGAERQESVHIGLRHGSAEWVLVHDGVRPFVSEDVMQRCLDAAKQFGGAIAAVPVKDTVKMSDEAGQVTETLDRSRLWAAQTPQAFRRLDLLKAHDQAVQDGFLGTDDASVAERSGIPVHLALGDYHNIKITTPDDLAWAEYRLASGKT